VGISPEDGKLPAAECIEDAEDATSEAPGVGKYPLVGSSTPLKRSGVIGRLFAP
jgi:hypothetical protein